MPLRDTTHIHWTAGAGFKCSATVTNNPGLLGGMFVYAVSNKLGFEMSGDSSISSPPVTAGSHTDYRSGTQIGGVGSKIDTWKKPTLNDTPLALHGLDRCCHDQGSGLETSGYSSGKTETSRFLWWVMQVHLAHGLSTNKHSPELPMVEVGFAAC